MAEIPTVQMNNGAPIPQLGFGVFQIDPAETREATLAALEVGYRHIDTAQMYRNERGVGEAIRDSGLARSEVFVTTKLSNANHDPGDARRSIEGSLEELGLDHVDLFLVHGPMPAVVDFLETWRAMEAIRDAGQARAIGVSNFTEAHLRRLLDAGATVPAVNQIEVHPWLAQNDLRRFASGRGIVTEAWSPIARGKVLGDPEVIDLANAVGRTPAQVVLRWHIQRGDVVFPKTVHRERMIENASLFDFELDESAMQRLDALDRGERIGPDPDRFQRVP
ncbi:MAG: aldo/keto reductase [Microthrixaceae bacterium]